MPTTSAWEVMKLSLPVPVEKVFKGLESCGFCGYLVGGCVRDYLLDTPPTDFDMTTDATPDEIISCFTGHRVLKTGIRHGTVTIILDGMAIEITTHRTEGDYSDSRHPDAVKFTKNLADDLARRDFTINAMAYHPQKGLIDRYGGAADIKNKIIRGVGDPHKRMAEDALRMLRGLRFAAVLGFDLDEETRTAIRQNCGQLANISAERIAAELNKLICGKNAKTIILEETTVLGVVIPELLPAKNFDQQNPHHCYDVLTHTAVAMETLAPVPRLRWAMLFHDLGKPQTFTLDAAGVGHFKGHSKCSEAIARERLTALRMSNVTIDQVCALVKYHGTIIEEDKKSVKRWLNRLSEPLLRDLIAIKRGDNLAKASKHHDRLESLQRLEALLDQVIAEKACFSLKDLAVNGHDLMGLGIKNGEEIGRILNLLLAGVIDEVYENEKDSLIKKAKEMRTC
ncbi:CCA tRNA nucleotidyltransferase [Acetobacterium sp. K1/6]|uniref:CCA tRNA nucleotidyltransferase n=1 Tax=Acetobacterium sp. K1/6 TaxID=3055467 RepID=UPI002ACAFC12|nr:HD domain-containing protein [Acetobacterium sp. K1/6]MDZ5724208.1 HD domain-containing protein [Acetobacterium sp. K1/6]